MGRYASAYSSGHAFHTGNDFMAIEPEQEQARRYKLAKENYFLGFEQPDSIIFNRGLEWLVQNPKTPSIPASAWIAVNRRESIGNIAKHSGLGRLAIFHKRNVSRTLIHDCLIELVTGFEIPSDGFNRPLLAFHPTPDFLAALEGIPNIQKMLVIPWIAEEVDGWAKKAFAKDLENPELPSIYVDEIALTAFKHLKFEFTESPPSSPSQYRNAICQTLQILVENGTRFELQALQSALIQKCGWGPVSAKQAAELAGIFLSNHTPAGYDGQGPWENGIIKLWRIEAAKAEAK